MLLASPCTRRARRGGRPHGRSSAPRCTPPSHARGGGLPLRDPAARRRRRGSQAERDWTASPRRPVPTAARVPTRSCAVSPFTPKAARMTSSSPARSLTVAASASRRMGASRTISSRTTEGSSTVTTRAPIAASRCESLRPRRSVSNSSLRSNAPRAARLRWPRQGEVIVRESPLLAEEDDNGARLAARALHRGCEERTSIVGWQKLPPPAIESLVFGEALAVTSRPSRVAAASGASSSRMPSRSAASTSS